MKVAIIFLLDHHSHYMMFNMWLSDVWPFHRGYMSHFLVAEAVPLKSGTNINQHYCCNFTEINLKIFSSHPSVEATCYHTPYASTNPKNTLAIMALQTSNWKQGWGQAKTWWYLGAIQNLIFYPWYKRFVFWSCMLWLYSWYKDQCWSTVFNFSPQMLQFYKYKIK